MTIQRYLVTFHLEDGQSADGLGDRVFEAVERVPGRPSLFSVTNVKL